MEKYIRKNIRELIPYSSARDEYKGENAIFLDANENPYNRPYNRYPDPLQTKLKEKIRLQNGINPENIFLGNGSDEAIDLLIRIFCNPGINNIIVTDPTYGMYEVCARINDVEVRKVSLNNDFSLDPGKIFEAVNEESRLIFLCSPNNPTSNLLSESAIKKIIEGFNGIVVIDEAYIDFSGTNGWLPMLPDYSNLVILRTFSKAWGLAGIRLGMAIADKEIIKALNKIKYPYNVNILTQAIAIKYLDKVERKEKLIKAIIKERNILQKKLESFKIVQKVYPSDANFLLIRINQPLKVFNFLKDHKLIVRDRSRVTLCDNCLRITVGTKKENKELLNLLKEYEKKFPQ